MRCLAMMIGGAAALVAAAPASEIAFPRPRIFPESITATSAGELFVSDADDGTIWHARPGDAAASEWLSPARSGMVAMLGVYADEASGTLWACGRPRTGDTDDARDRESALFAYDLRARAPKGRWPMPGGAKAVCNDIARGPDGSLYIAETAGGRIIRLAPGAAALEEWFADPRLAGADGIAFDSDGTLYVSTVTTGRAFRLTIDSAGRPSALTELTPSRALDHPDGLRAIAPHRFLVSENGEHGGIAEARVDGDRLTLRTLDGSRPGTTSAVLSGGLVYGVVAKLRYRAPEMAGQDPGPFSIYAIPLG
jgi:sugar lactone lactonase YvrE